MRTKWTTATRKHPCPICQKPDWCGVNESGELAICMRVQSSKESKNGGYIHILKESVPDYKYIPSPKQPPKPKPVLDIDTMFMNWRNKTSATQIDELAKILGVSYDALRRLDPVWAKEHNAWGFPMRNELDQMTGVRLRNNQGSKWAIKGSHAGLFVPNGMESKTLLIVEGPTDTAAGLTLGFDTIGRPSCRGQEELVVKWLSQRRYREIVLIVDNDKKDKLTGKYPGAEGVKKLAITLNKPVKVIRSPLKDIRTWLSCGLNATELNNFINNTKAKTIEG